ncbi:hypothetical protein ACFV3R_16960 [Streptomyces sp. NPDC059740]|uniref:hypothetical protein n=1 Tax=Streptomyces sp. NPDC059740 TaxID=3346926 RepID=UPI00365BE779
MTDEPQEPGLPDTHPVLLYLDALRARMADADFELLMRMVDPIMAAIREQRVGNIDIDLGEDEGRVTPQMREEVSTLVTIAITGRMDHEFVEVDTDGEGHPVRVMVDSDTARDPERLAELREWARDRQQQDDELRGIAEVSDMRDEL